VETKVGKTRVAEAEKRRRNQRKRGQ